MEKMFYNIDEYFEYLKKHGVGEVFYRVTYRKVGHFDVDIFVYCSAIVDDGIASLLTLYKQIRSSDVSKHDGNAFDVLAQFIKEYVTKAEEWIKQELKNAGFAAFAGVCMEKPFIRV